VNVATEPEFKSFSVGSMDNNVYILVDPASRESVLFDAPTDAARILAELEGTHLQYILMTHADQDHVGVLEEIKRATGAPIGAHPDTNWNMPIPPDFEVHDGDTYTVGGFEITALFTPGHSPGSVSYVIGDILIAGDTLFPGGPGNTRNGHGNFDTIIDSIRTKLFSLPDETRVYPGHGTATTIGAEKPHLQEWIDRGW
jgi:glyoxylase-like metal-dependent hydrolase (beta-lactamase superfamily II)